VRGPHKPRVLGLDGVAVDTVEPTDLRNQLAAGGKVVVVDLATSRRYAQGHIPGAWFAIRSQFPRALEKLPTAAVLVLTSPDGSLAQLAAADVVGHASAQVMVLQGGTAAWIDARLPLETGASHMASEPEDVVLLARERGQNREEAMREYLAWEIDLVNRRATDDDQRFRVVAA